MKCEVCGFEGTPRIVSEHVCSFRVRFRGKVIQLSELTELLRLVDTENVRTIRPAVGIAREHYKYVIE